MSLQLDLAVAHAQTIGITGHIRPDGDCIGSTLAAYNYITENYPDKEVHLFLDEFLDVFAFLKGADKIQHDYPDMPAFDLFISLDCASIDRFPEAEKYLKSAKDTICIDHHVSNGGFAAKNEIRPDASSACEVLFDCLDEKKISKEVAECLYVGIIHDTGVFRYSCTSSHTMQIAGKLIEYGFDFPKIIDDTFSIKTYEQNRILGRALEDAQLHFDGKVILSILSQEELDEFEVTTKDLDAIAPTLRMTTGVEIAVFLYPTATDYKVSLRSNGMDVSAVAVSFGGGGHERAAGCNLQMDAEHAVETILQRLEPLF